MYSLALLIDTILGIYVWVIIISVVLSWLVAFDVVNARNEVMRMILQVTYNLTEPILRPIRQFMPNLGGIDISPVIVLLGIMFARSLLREYGPL